MWACPSRGSKGNVTAWCLIFLTISYSKRVTLWSLARPCFANILVFHLIIVHFTIVLPRIILSKASQKTADFFCLGRFGLGSSKLFQEKHELLMHCLCMLLWCEALEPRHIGLTCASCSDVRWRRYVSQKGPSVAILFLALWFCIIISLPMKDNKVSFLCSPKHVWAPKLHYS